LGSATSSFTRSGGPNRSEEAQPSEQLHMGSCPRSATVVAAGSPRLRSALPEPSIGCGFDDKSVADGGVPDRAFGGPPSPAWENLE
jgi:hypothetical protein